MTNTAAPKYESGDENARRSDVGLADSSADAAAIKPVPMKPAAPPAKAARRNPAMKFQYATGARPLDGYTIKRGIGVGGFGEVYYAISDAGKDVALKLIQRNLDIELRGVSHCLNLKHPNLLALFDIKYDEAGNGWVVMEYVPGESLRDVLRRNPNGLPQEQINVWLTGIAAGVACLHTAGVVHRDLKPGNLFDDGGIIKIGDYGLSKFISVSRRSAQTESVGTCHYMAPEVGRGRYGREIDVYAMGIMLYEMLTGRLPFDGESSQEILMKHMTDKPDLTGLPEPYKTTIARALEKDPEKRIRTVGDFLASLGLSLPGSVAASQAASAVSEEPVTANLVNDATKRVMLQPIDFEGNDEMKFGPVENVGALVPVAKTVTPPAPEEPIAKVLKTSWQKTTGWFTNPAVNTPLKLGLLITGVCVALFNAEWLVPLAIAVAIVYGVYYAIRAIILSNGQASNLATDHTNDTLLIDGSETHSSAGRGKKKWLARARLSMAQRPLAVRGGELVGSMLMSTLVSGVLSVVMMIAAGGEFGGPIYDWGPQFAWLTIACTASAWAILLSAKAWEADFQGDQVLRRFLMLGIGLGLGVFAYGMDQMLLAELNYGNTIEKRWVPASFHQSGVPQMAAYLAYFGGLFAIVRLWRQADPLRNARFSLWAMILCGLWGFALPFPQPWGFLLAAGISIAVQLSAPWVNSKERALLKKRYQLEAYRL